MTTHTCVCIGLCNESDNKWKMTELYNLVHRVVGNDAFVLAKSQLTCLQCDIQNYE